MSKIVWDKNGERLYEIGLDHGVCYVQDTTGAYQDGVAWNGLTSVSESPEGGESNKQYADNIEYLNIRSKEEFKGTIEAYTYPKEFEVCDGIVEPVPGLKIGQQTRRPFGFSYRTKIGNDIEGSDYAYQLHLVYGCTVSPSEKSRETENDSPEPITLSWEFDTIPVEIKTKVAGKVLKPAAHIVINSTDYTTEAAKTKLTALEDILYGTEGEGNAEGTAPRLPLPDEVIQKLTVA